MNMSALRWTLIASALTLGLAACTVTTDDDEPDGGTGGATGGSGGATGGTGGATGGTGGATGGTGGGDTGGTGGSAGCTADPSDLCSTCMATNCCDEYLACEADAFCPSALDCMATCTDDLTTCATTCDNGEMNVPFNEYFACWNESCVADCTM